MTTFTKKVAARSVYMGDRIVSDVDGLSYTVLEIETVENRPNPKLRFGLADQKYRYAKGDDMVTIVAVPGIDVEAI